VKVYKDEKTGRYFRNVESPEQFEMMKKIHEMWYQDRKRKLYEIPTFPGSIQRPKGLRRDQKLSFF
jgi:hypothetical protein